MVASFAVEVVRIERGRRYASPRQVGVVSVLRTQ
jgi:hypothetical protein